MVLKVGAGPLSSVESGTLFLGGSVALFFIAQRLFFPKVSPKRQLAGAGISTAGALALGFGIQHLLTPAPGDGLRQRNGEFLFIPARDTACASMGVAYKTRWDGEITGAGRLLVSLKMTSPDEIDAPGVALVVDNHLGWFPETVHTSGIDTFPFDYAPGTILKFRIELREVEMESPFETIRVLASETHSVTITDC